MGGLAGASYGFAPALASALLHSLWQGALLAVAAALALQAMRSSSAAARHNMAMAFLVAMTLAPAVQFLGFWRRPELQIEYGLLPVVTAPRLSAAADVFVQESSPLAAALVLVWLAGVALMLARHLGGLSAIAAIERLPSHELPARWRRRFDELRGALGVARTVAVRLSDEVLTPWTARLVRPMIWLPLSLLTRAPAEQLEALLAHELAHIARKDWLWNGLQCAIEALLFFHPAVWWLGRRIRQEREHACDDLAVAACGDAVALAEALAALERARRAAPLLALAGGGGALLQRVSRLLTAPASRGRRGALPLLGALSVPALLLIVQIGLSGGGLPDLQLRSSTAGALGPGDYREIVAGGSDKQRFYRVSLDAQGRPTEIYREDGRDRPIDADVRRWIGEVTRLGGVPTGSMPPVVPKFEDTADYQALLALVAATPDVAARLGTPVVAAPGPVNGTVRFDETGRGEADVRIDLRGPNGRAVAATKADFRDGDWTLRSVALR